MEEMRECCAGREWKDLMRRRLTYLGRCAVVDTVVGDRD
jgi:hypothetical protein